MQITKMRETSVMAVRSSSTSLKTTIPEFYTELLGLKKGDRLEWTHKQVQNGEFVIEIRKARK